MTSRDTTPAAHAAQVRALRSMSPAARLRAALEMSDDLRAFRRAGLRHQHPDWDATRIERELAAEMLRAAFLPL